MLNSFLAEYGVTAEPPVMMVKQTYVIIESLLEKDLMKIVYQNGIADLPHAKLFADTEYKEFAEKGPLIVQLSANNDSLSVLMGRFEKQPSGCFIQSAQSFESVLTWARQRLTAQTGQAKALLRYYEPRMLLPLLASLDGEEKAAFLTGIDSLHWFHHAWLSFDVTAIDEQQRKSNEASLMADYKGLLLSSRHLNKMESIQQQWAEQGKVSYVE